MLEKAMISGVTHTVEEAVFEVRGSDPAVLFETLAGAGVSVDTLIQIGDEVVFSAPAEDQPEIEAALDGLGLAWSDVQGLGKVSVVGAGMKSHPGVAARTFATVRDRGVEAQFVSTSPIKISFYVGHDDVDRTVAALHEAFDLSSPAAERQHA